MVTEYLLQSPVEGDQPGTGHEKILMANIKKVSLYDLLIYFEIHLCFLNKHVRVQINYKI
jgi:hypothetical protein